MLFKKKSVRVVSNNILGRMALNVDYSLSVNVLHNFGYNVECHHYKLFDKT